MPVTPFTKLGCAVPSIIWDSFEEALQTNMERLARDVATCLGQPEQPLLKAIKSTKVQPYLIELNDDSRDIDIRCDYICQRGDSMRLLQPCGQAVFWGATKSSRCPQHMYSVVNVPSSLPTLKVLSTIEDVPQMYVGEDDTLYDAEYIARGRIADGKIILFEIAEDE